jgi:Mannosyltransferase putative
MRGVFFLANDHVFDQAVAFLTSFRRSNPDLPLQLIPFADDCERITALAPRYGFTVSQDHETLLTCDEIGRPFHGQRVGQYRKLAAWSGPFDEFIYIDCDTVVLEPVDFVFDFLAEFDVLTSHSNMPDNRRWVWRHSIYQSGALTAQQIGFAANTGFIASKAGLFDAAKVLATVDEALAVAEHMELGCYEQAFLNYLIVTSGHAYTSLLAIAKRTGRRDIPLERWAGRDIGEVSEGKIVSPGDSKALLVHWAGEWERARWRGGVIPHRELWQYYRDLHQD